MSSPTVPSLAPSDRSDTGPNGRTRSAPGRPGQRGRQRAGPRVVKERLVRRADGQYLPGRSPAADPSPGRAPVGKPGAGPVGETGRVDLRTAVPGAGPGHLRPVRRQPRRRRLRLVRGEPPGPAAGDRRQPDVVGSDENHQTVSDMRESQVSRRRHRAIVRFHPAGSRTPSAWGPPPGRRYRS